MASSGASGNTGPPRVRSRLRDTLRAAAPPHPWALAGVLLALVAASLGGDATGGSLRYERAAIAAGEAWRLYTAHLVHNDATHLAMNLGGLVLLWWLFARDDRPWSWAAVALASATTVAAGLWFLSPVVSWYVGASGVLHGLWAAAAVAAARRWPLEGGVTFVLLAAKLVVEQLRGPLSGGLDAALPVIVDAHLYGAVGGLLAAVALRAGRRSL